MTFPRCGGSCGASSYPRWPSAPPFRRLLKGVCAPAGVRFHFSPVPGRGRSPLRKAAAGRDSARVLRRRAGDAAHHGWHFLRWRERLLAGQGTTPPSLQQFQRALRPCDSMCDSRLVTRWNSGETRQVRTLYRAPSFSSRLAASVCDTSRRLAPKLFLTLFVSYRAGGVGACVRDIRILSTL